MTPRAVREVTINLKVDTFMSLYVYIFIKIEKILLFLILIIF